MQTAHPISRHMHHVRTSTDTTTYVVTFSPRQVALYHLKHFVKVSIVVATTIIVLLYTALLVIGAPTINL